MKTSNMRQCNDLPLLGDALKVFFDGQQAHQADTEPLPEPGVGFDRIDPGFAVLDPVPGDPFAAVVDSVAFSGSRQSLI